MNGTEVPSDLMDALHHELAPSEVILWADQPDRLRLMKATWGQAGMGLFLAAFGLSIFKQRFQERGNISGFEILFMGVFLFIAGSALLSPFKAWRKGLRTVYAVSNERALVLVLGRQRIVESFSGEVCASFERREDANSNGDIVFERQAVRGPKGRTLYQDRGFLSVKNVRAVSALLAEVSRKTAGSELAKPDPGMLSGMA